MSAINVKSIKGKVPRVSERLLGGNYATEVLNCKLTSGRLDPLRGLALAHTSLAAAVKTIWRHRFGTLDNWLVWPTQVHAAKSPTVQDTLGRTYFTGDGEPRMTTFAAAITGPGPFPAGWFVLGVYIPIVAPTLGHTGGAAANEDRAYAYAFATTLGEEGALSPPTIHTAPSDATSWNLSAMELPPPNSGTVSAAVAGVSTVDVTLDTVRGLAVNEEITFAGVGGMTSLNGTRRIEAINTGTNKVTVALVTAQVYTAGGTWARRAPHNTAGMTRRIYRSVGTNASWKLVVEQVATLTTFTDNVASTALGTVPTVALDTYTPPKHGHGLVTLANGAVAMIAGNELFISEQYKPHSWPLSNRYAFAGQGEGLSAAGNSLIVVTDGYPVVATATVPESASLAKLEDVYAPCVSRTGVVDTGSGCLFPSFDGLWYLTPAGGKKITEATYELDEWRAIKPETFNACFWNNCYYAMHEAADGELQGRIWQLCMAYPDFVLEIDERVDALYANERDGRMYVAQGQRLLQWDADDSQRYLSFWKSGDFQTAPPTNFTCGQVHARYADIVPVDSSVLAANLVLLANADLIENALGDSELGVYPVAATNLQEVALASANRVQFSILRENNVIYTTELDSSKPFRLPGGFKSEVHSFQIASSLPVYSMTIATSMAELARASE